MDARHPYPPSRKVLLGAVLFIFLLTACGTQPAPPAAPTSPPTETPTPQPTLTPTPTVVPGPFEGQPAIPYPSDEVVQELGITAYQVVGERYVALSEEGYIVAQAITNEKGEFTGWQRTLPFDVASGLVVPHPQETNPELLDLKKSDAPIPQFVNAMEMAGIEVEPEEVANNLQYQVITGADGNRYVIATFNLDPDPNQQGETLEGPIPLMVWGEKGWEEINTGNISALTDVSFGLGNIMEGPYYYYQFSPQEKNAQIELSRVYSFGDVFQASAILWKGEGKYDWSRPDYFVNLLKSRAGKIRGGHFVWHNDTFPEWFNALKIEAIQSPDKHRERFIDILTNYIRAAVVRYKDNIHQWSLLNEIVGPDGNLDQNNFWVKIIGPDLPRIAIEAVRSADATAEIIINDFGVEFSGPKSDGYYRLIKQLREQGLLSSNDIVGFQFHISVRDPRLRNLSSAKEEIKKNLRRFIDLGVKVAVTELDIMELWSNDPQSLIKQAEMYKSVVEACFELNLEYSKPVCDSIVVWGLSDNSTWLYYVMDKPGYPLLFNSEGRPKPSYYSVLESYFTYLNTK